MFQQYYEIFYSQLIDHIIRKRDSLPENLKDYLYLKNTSQLIQYERGKIKDDFLQYADLNVQFEGISKTRIDIKSGMQWYFSPQVLQKEEWHLIFGTSKFLESITSTNQPNDMCQNFPFLTEVLSYLEEKQTPPDFRVLLDKNGTIFYNILIKNLVDKNKQFSNVFSIRPLAMENKSYNYVNLKLQITLILSTFIKIKNNSNGQYVVINTGFLGCGFYLNNYVLMALIQFLIAELVGIDELVFNPHNKPEQAKLAYDIYQLIRNSLQGRQDVKFISKLPEFLEKVNFKTDIHQSKVYIYFYHLIQYYQLIHSFLLDTQTNQEILNSVKNCIPILTGQIIPIQKYPHLSNQIYMNQDLYNQSKNDLAQKLNDKYYQKEVYDQYNLSKYNQQQPDNDHIILKSRHFDNNQLGLKKNQYQINQQVNKYDKTAVDTLNSNNLEDENLRVTILISQLLHTQLKNMHPNKQFLYERFIHKDFISEIQHDMLYVRCLKTTPYPPDELLINVLKGNKTKIEAIQSEFTYEKSEQDIFQWHVNFADSQLFGFYETSLFAQDEIQTCENPILYHLKEKIVIQSKTNPYLKPITKEENNPTPILIVNSLREGKVNPKPTKNNPLGLYGRNFERASFKAIAEACQQIQEDQINDVNIISMCSLSYHTGQYTLDQIKFTFTTAYKSFREAYITAKKMYSGHNNAVIINTGNWGSGAFGNNPELIAIIQILAAEISQINQLNYYTFDQKGYSAFVNGQKNFNQIKQKILASYEPKTFSQYVEIFLNIIFTQKYEWSISDGN